MYGESTVSGQAAVVSVQLERTDGCRVASATVSSPLLQLLVFAARDCSLCAIQQKRIAIVVVAVKSWVSIYWKLLSFDQNQRHWRLGGELCLAFLKFEPSLLRNWRADDSSGCVHVSLLIRSVGRAVCIAFHYNEQSTHYVLPYKWLQLQQLRMFNVTFLDYFSLMLLSPAWLVWCALLHAKPWTRWGTCRHNMFITKCVKDVTRC